MYDFYSAEIRDLSRQIQILLQESGTSNNNQSRISFGNDESENGIPSQQLTFRNIEVITLYILYMSYISLLTSFSTIKLLQELQQRNQELLKLVRQLKSEKDIQAQQEHDKQLEVCKLSSETRKRRENPNSIYQSIIIWNTFLIWILSAYLFV